MVYVLRTAQLCGMSHALGNMGMRFYYSIQDGMKFKMYGLIISRILPLIISGYVWTQVMDTMEK